LQTDWVVPRECTIGVTETCDLGTGKLTVRKQGYLNILSGGKMLAAICDFENSSARYRVWKQSPNGMLKCGS
jgi:hypothetical protein